MRLGSPGLARPEPETAARESVPGVPLPQAPPHCAGVVIALSSLSALQRLPAGLDVTFRGRAITSAGFAVCCGEQVAEVTMEISYLASNLSELAESCQKTLLWTITPPIGGVIVHDNFETGGLVR